MSFLEELLRRAAAAPQRIVLPEGEDPRVIEAAAELKRLGVAQPIIVGGDGIDPVKDDRHQQVAEYLRRRRPDAVDDAIHALDLAADPLRFGAALVGMGEADGCVAGARHSTADVLRAALWAIGTAPGVATVSSSFYMVMPDGRVFTFADCGVVPEPTDLQLADIALAACRDRTRIVGDVPRVAFLSFSSHGSASSDSVDRVASAVQLFRERAPGIVADGELQVDAALVPEVAERKAPESQLQGRANVLVFPSLDAGNIGYKLVQRLAGAAALGPVLQGLAHPMADLSRGATSHDIVQIAGIVALQAAPAVS